MPVLSWSSRMPLLLLFCYGGWASSWGLASDNDSELLLQAAEHLRMTGEYMRSRTSGFPLYEGLVALCLSIGLSIRAINIVTLTIAGGALLLAARITGREQPWRGTFAQVLLLTWPVFLSSSAEIMETMLSLWLALWLVWLALRQPWLGLAHGIVATLLVLARLDAALLVIAVAMTALIRHQASPGRAMSWLAVTGLASLLCYIAINGGIGFLATDSLGLDGLARRLVRAAAGMVNVLQLTGWLGLAFLGLQAWRWRVQPRPLSAWRAQLRMLAVVTSGLYSIRFLALPDEIFYLAIPGALWLLVIASDVSARSSVMALMLAGVLQSLVSLSLFARVPGSADTLRVAPALNPGPLFQERAQRLAFQALRDSARRAALSCRLYPDCPSLRLDHAAPYLAAADGRRAVISARYLYVFFSPRYPAQSQGGYREVTACTEEVVPSTSGWRVWQPAIPAYLTDVLAAGGAPHCRVVPLPRRTRV